MQSTPFNPETGKDLTVVIFSEPTSQGDWGSFALWYTCQKMWPDARYFVSLPKRPLSTHLLRWLDRCRVRRIRHADDISMTDRLTSLISAKICTKPTIGLSYQLLANRKPSDNELNCLFNNGTVKDSLDKFVYIGTGGKNETLSSFTATLEDEPSGVFYSINNKIGTFDCNLWCEKTHAAPFGATWNTTNPHEKRVMELWGGMFNYHAMVAK